MAEALRGNLDRVSLSGLLQLVETESLQGWLRFDRGELAARNGLVTQARYRGLSGATAVVEALVTARGEFVFEERSDVPDGQVGSTPGLIMESCRVVDELERLGPLHFARAEGWSLKVDDLDLRLFARALDGTRPTIDLLADRDLHVVPAVRWLAERLAAGDLRAMGSTELSAMERLRARWKQAQPDPVRGVEPPAPKAAAAAAAPAAPAPAVRVSPGVDARADDLIFRARGASRDGRYDDAERALVEALALRPGDRIAAQNLARVRRLLEQ